MSWCLTFINHKHPESLHFPAFLVEPQSETLILQEGQTKPLVCSAAGGLFHAFSLCRMLIITEAPQRWCPGYKNRNGLWIEFGQKSGVQYWRWNYLLWRKRSSTDNFLGPGILKTFCTWTLKDIYCVSGSQLLTLNELSEIRRSCSLYQSTSDTFYICNVLLFYHVKQPAAHTGTCDKLPG